MRGQTSIILAFVFALIVAIFAVINVDPVQVNYLFGSGDAPLIIVILSSVLMGGIIVAAFGFIKFYKLKRENKSLKKALTSLQEETSQLEKNKEEQAKMEKEQLSIDNELNTEEAVSNEEEK